MFKLLSGHYVIIRALFKINYRLLNALTPMPNVLCIFWPRLIKVMIINHKCANSCQTAQIIIHTIYFEYNIHRSVDNFSIDTPACHSRDNTDIS